MLSPPSLRKNELVSILSNVMTSVAGRAFGLHSTAAKVQYIDIGELRSYVSMLYRANSLSAVR